MFYPAPFQKIHSINKVLKKIKHDQNEAHNLKFEIEYSFNAPELVFINFNLFKYKYFLNF